MEKTIYVIGHKNPDTDSVVSAVAYAKLKNLMGYPEYTAARAGHLNPQTTYIFEKFGLARPHYVPDLIPKVEYFMPKGVETVSQNVSIWEAIGIMKKKSIRVLPVVDADGKYISMLHYTGFANGVLKFMNPEKHNFISTNLSLIQKTLNAQVLVQTFEADKVFKGHVLVASSSTDKFEKTLKSHASEELIVIASDRDDIHELCIENKVKVLIITSGFALKKEVREKAEKAGVSVLISPYSTSPTSELISFAMPVSVIGDSEIRPVYENDTVSTDEIVIGDNDTLGAIVAVSVNADLLIILSDIDGLYTKNPKQYDDAELLTEVTELTDDIVAMGKGRGSALGTGGMKTKLNAAGIVMAEGIDMVIANGQNPEVLYDIVEGKKIGTRFIGRSDKK